MPNLSIIPHDTTMEYAALKMNVNELKKAYLVKNTAIVALSVKNAIQGESVPQANVTRKTAYVAKPAENVTLTFALLATEIFKSKDCR